MKKIRLMVLALIVAVAMTGAGYAAWSTKIIYNNTMKTAEWNVFIENDSQNPNDRSLDAGDSVSNFNSNFVTSDTTSELHQYDTEGVDLSGAIQGNGENYVYTIEPSITASEVTTVESPDTVNFKFFNMHPGTSVLTRFEIRNRGTIPAQIADVNVILNNGAPLSDEQQHVVNAMIVSGKFWDHIGSGPSTLIGEIAPNTKLIGLADELRRILAKEGYQLREQHNVNLSHLDGSEVEVDNGLEFTIPADALKVGGKNVGTLEQISVRIEFDFVQYNQNVPTVK